MRNPATRPPYEVALLYTVQFPSTFDAIDAGLENAITNRGRTYFWRRWLINRELST